MWSEIIEGLLSISPWLAFIIAVLWCWVLGLREEQPSSRLHESEHRPRPEKTIERSYSAPK